ncbi:MAG: hypothetical protein PUE13_07185 [Clostridiales bacterium]|nr:hypothetical protein [Clostridiales bacterium]
MSAIYINNKLSVSVNRFFNTNGSFKEQVIIKNISPSVVCINRDNFGIELPFNDKYTYADDCMTNRCNTHIWCGGNTSWVNALKMGNSEINLGLALTKGAFISYSQNNCLSSNTRGCFIFEPETVLLKRNEEYVLEWELFWHEGKKDFLKKLTEYETYIGIDAKHFTVFEGEKIEFKITPHNFEKPTVFCEGKTVNVTKKTGNFYVSYTPKKTGVHRFIINCGSVTTYAEFMVKIPFSELTEKRLNFIVDKQQCLDAESPLYGAYLIYDNKISGQYFDFSNTDHNACRERLNMPLAIIRYLQFHNNKKFRDSIDLFIKFLFREFYEEKTGEVFNNIGKTRDALRLYNAPGVMLIFAEMYYLTKEEKYLDNILKLAEKYYSVGGEKCYSNAVAIRKVIGAFELSGRIEDKKEMLGFFHLHVDNIIKNGLSYPKHEVNYEQTIVTPAVNCISEMGLYCEDKEFYISEASKHLECLDRFVGQQPSFHLNEISVRFWDDYYFGKGMRYGDTFPHHLSCLTARAFIAYARLTGDKEYIERAEECIRNCLCLIGDNGQGAAAYVYPHMVNNREGEFYDEWANDQDLPLYDGMNFCDLIETFKI